MINSNTIKVFSWILTLAVLGLLIFLLKDCRGFMAPAPAGIHGNYSSASYQPTYKTLVSKDSLLQTFRVAKILVKTGRLNSYDAPWDSLSYILGNIPCDAEHVEAYIQFSDKNERQSTFRVLWFNTSPTTNDEDYDRLTKRYYNCFEERLKDYHVTKLSDTLGSNR